MSELHGVRVSRAGRNERALRRWALAALWAASAAAASAAEPDPHRHETASPEAMAAEHAGDAPAPSPAALAEPRGPVETSAPVYATLDGEPVTGFLARPQGAAGPLPGVLLIHEWWGLNDNLRAIARQLAGEGYLALAVDLYGGRSATTPEAARALMQASMQSPERGAENLRAARAFLAGQGATRIGVVGWCFGGGWALQAGLRLGDELDAVVMYYGRVETDPAALARLRAPLLGLFAGRDTGIPVDAVRAFERALAEAGRPAEIRIYEGADHAFANPSGGRYDEAAARDAWARTLAFLAKHLRPAQE
jgi:carboxymethylenebutenolidase